MTPRTELDRLFADSLAKIAKPEAIDCTGVKIGNSDIESSSTQGNGPNPDGANTLPIYPKTSDLEIER